MKRNKLFISTLDASIVLTSAGSSITVQTTRVKPGFFNEHVTLQISHVDAVRLYLWLGEEVGKEAQS